MGDACNLCGGDWYDIQNPNGTRAGKACAHCDMVCHVWPCAACRRVTACLPPAR
jgi:hypothetical protein